MKLDEHEASAPEPQGPILEIEPRDIEGDLETSLQRQVRKRFCDRGAQLPPRFFNEFSPATIDPRGLEVRRGHDCRHAILPQRLQGIERALEVGRAIIHARDHMRVEICNPR